MCAACLNSPAGWWPFGFMCACLHACADPKLSVPSSFKFSTYGAAWASFGWSNTRNVVSWFFWGGCSDHFIAEGVTQRWFPCVMHSCTRLHLLFGHLQCVLKVSGSFFHSQLLKNKTIQGKLLIICGVFALLGTQLFVRHKTKIIFSSSHNKGRRWQLFSNLPTKTSLCDKNKSVNPWE